MKKIYLTYDMEWSNDELLKWFYQKLDEYNVKATINVTHETSMLDVFRADDRIELGIHPNFNKLLNAESEIKYNEVIDNLKAIVPEAVTVRSHSLVKSNVISKLYADKGFTHESNIFIEPFYVSGCRAGGFRDCFNLIQVPISFEDDLYLNSCNKKEADWYLNMDNAALIFNFHPIHLFLNTDYMCRYEKAKPYYHNFNLLKSYINESGDGIFTFYDNLIKKAKIKGWKFDVIKNIIV